MRALVLEVFKWWSNVPTFSQRSNNTTTKNSQHNATTNTTQQCVVL